MYAVMRDTVYILADRFKEIFWNDCQMLLGTNHVIRNSKDCDFTLIYASTDDEVGGEIFIQDKVLVPAANPEVEYLVEEPDEDQPFIQSPPAPPRPVDHKNLCALVDILQKQIYALQDELREERQLRIQADDELSRLLHKH